MVDSPFYRPPDDLPGGDPAPPSGFDPAAPPSDEPAALSGYDPAVRPAPGPAKGEPRREVRKTRRTAGDGPGHEADVWIPVFSGTDYVRAALFHELLSQRGVQTWLRTEEIHAGGGRHEVLVPEPEAELAQALVDSPLAREVAEHEHGDDQPGDDIFLLRQRIDEQMAGATRRRRERAYKKALAQLDPGRDGRMASEALFVIGVMVAFGLVVAVLAMLAQ